MVPAARPSKLPADLADLRASVLRTALAVTRNRAEAEDLVQIAFMRALDHADSLTPETNWAAWLKTVVRRLAVDLARRNRRWRLTEWLDALETAVLPNGEPERPWAAISTEQLAAAVDSIDGNYRIVYRLHHEQGASYAQVAQRLNIPVRTVGTRLHRARGRIRARLLKNLAAELEVASA